MRIYLSGPMTGIENFNYPAFHVEAARMRELGYHVENPAENAEQPSWNAYMRQAVRQMLTCDKVALLPGWQRSRGALVEHWIAIALGMSARPCEEFTGHD